jgi:hypothetical protein
MFQFTGEQRRQLRAKSQKEPYIINSLKEMCKEVYDTEILLPKEGIANWGLYYYCPKCSVRLIFETKNPLKHECPECHAIYSGEPYDGSWWYQINVRNSVGSYHMGLFHLIADDLSYARKAIDIMLEYAKYYKGYQEHGDIPYNDMGKANAQTLDEAIFLRSFAAAYDLLYEVMTEKERIEIKDGMLIPGGEFLMEHRHNQIHNHEVITDAAIAILGILFDREDMLQFGLYDKYGLIYQLEHGMLMDHMWFEGTLAYHFFALSNFLAFEKFAVHTKYSSILHPNYQKMLEIVSEYLLPDDTLPMVNDINSGHARHMSPQLYEFAYQYIRRPKISGVLNQIYQRVERNSIEAFLYGVEDIPTGEIVNQNYHSAYGVGNTILRGPEDWYLLFKHGNYGGEHDHYDRLGILYHGQGQRIAPDLGTTGYGAMLHYDYYKNTGSHNTVAINEENQPPAGGEILRYEKLEDVTYVEAEVDWGAPYEMPDSYTIVQWDQESYKNVKMTRKIAWTDTYFVDLFLVEGVDPRYSIDWSLHVAGERKTKYPNEIEVSVLSEKKPLKYLHSVSMVEHKEAACTQYQCSEGVKMDLYSMNFGGQTYYGKGPDNPSVSDLDYVIERKLGGKAVYFHVVESYQTKAGIRKVEFAINKGIATASVYEVNKSEATNIEFSIE